MLEWVVYEGGLDGLNVVGIVFCFVCLWVLLSLEEGFVCVMYCCIDLEIENIVCVYL